MLKNLVYSIFFIFFMVVAIVGFYQLIKQTINDIKTFFHWLAKKSNPNPTQKQVTNSINTSKTVKKPEFDGFSEFGSIDEETNDNDDEDEFDDEEQMEIDDLQYMRLMDSTKDPNRVDEDFFDFYDQRADDDFDDSDSFDDFDE